MRKNISLSLMLSAFVLTACSKESPELIPCMCDSNADSTLGWFDCMCEPSKKKPVRRISYLQDKQKVRYQSLIIDEEQYNAYAVLHKNRNTYAPVKLENVDFRIKKNRKYDDFNPKLGDYHFRIFGCRRETKNAYLNQGRSMQKDMHFFDVFYETMNDYYPVVVEPTNVYYPDSDKIAQPEYLITAEITDYFMNICDEFDWEQAKSKKLRNGSSEMTVVWRVMNLSKDQVYCRGTTTGYGQIMEGEPNGETLLVERAFEDALIKLPEISCINSTLSRRVCQDDIDAQLAKIRRYEECDTCFKTQYAGELQGINLLQECETANGLRKHQSAGSSTINYTPIQTTNGEILSPVGELVTSTGERIITGGRTITSTGEQIVGVKDDGTLILGSSVVEDGGTSGRYAGYTLEQSSNGDLRMSTGGIKNSGYTTEGGVRDNNFTILDECQNIQIVDEECVVEDCPIVRNTGSVGISDDYFIDIPLEVDALRTGSITETGGVNGIGNKLNIGRNECIKSNGVIITKDGCIDSNGSVIGEEECIKARNFAISGNGGASGTGSVINGTIVTGDECIKAKDIIVANEECIMSNGIIITEDGCVDGNGTVITEEECTNARNFAIAEDGGSSGTGSVINGTIITGEECVKAKDIIVANEECIMSNGIIITEDGCVDGNGTVITEEECTNARNFAIAEDGGSSGTGSVINGTIITGEECVRAKNIIEDGGSSGTGMTIVEDGGSSGTGSIRNIEINEIGESAFAAVNNQFCIVNNPPFENLNPYNLYKLRASIVSVENSNGKKGAGLIIAENMVLTSADLIQKDNNVYNLQTVNGKHFKASAFRVNPTKNVAVLLLDKSTTYQPLPMALTLPEVNKDILLTLGLLNFDENGENYIDNEGRVVGYRWSEDRGAEIIVDTFVQTVTLGGALIDQKGNIIGIAHETKKSENSPDLFIPIETALKSLGLDICGQRPAINKPRPVQIYTPIADAIDNSKADKSPKPMKGKKRK